MRHSLLFPTARNINLKMWISVSNLWEKIAWWWFSRLSIQRQVSWRPDNTKEWSGSERSFPSYFTNFNSEFSSIFHWRKIVGKFLAFYFLNPIHLERPKLFLKILELIQSGWPSFHFQNHQLSRSCFATPKMGKQNKTNQTFASMNISSTSLKHISTKKQVGTNFTVANICSKNK